MLPGLSGTAARARPAERTSSGLTFGRGASVARSIEAGDQAVDERLPPLGALAEELPSVDCAKAGARRGQGRPSPESPECVSRSPPCQKIAGSPRSGPPVRSKATSLRQRPTIRAIIYNTAGRGSNRMAAQHAIRPADEGGRPGRCGHGNDGEYGGPGHPAPATNTKFPLAAACAKR